MLFLLMVNVNLGNSSEVLTTLGVTMVGASTLSFLLSNSCPFVCSSQSSTNNGSSCGENCTTDGGDVTNLQNGCNVRCPIGKGTRATLLVGISSFTIGNSLNLLSLLR